MANAGIDRMSPGLLFDRVRPYTPVLLLILLLLGIGIAQPDFLRPKDLSVILSDAAVLFELAAGMTFVIMLGGIDLSVQAGASFASMVVAELLPSVGYLAFPITILIGLVAGLSSGFVHVRLRIPSFIATLATGGIMTGLSLLMEAGQSVSLQQAGRYQCVWITGNLILGIPNVIPIACVVALGGLFLQRYTRFGRFSAAIGAGEPAARAAGISVARYKIMAFGLSGACAAFGGVLLAAKLGSGSPDLANQLLLPTIAAVVVGGTAITGGIGNIGLTVVGTLIVSIVRIGMTFLGVDIFAQQIVFGTALVFAVFVTIDRSKIAIIK
ncbi:ABC transporter permease [Acidisoma silvae]|uniref:ABC transporter permease n=1 Tax=Acidisoma silvae TaxID=2802396 RepID=A0A963YVB4_9PROT|nr:ABC transporter permease [Acidisoma silvae]MCB8877768.1 ABC transporter permease [Acidisoma silvae]